MSPQNPPLVYTQLQPGQIRLLYPDTKSKGEYHWSLKVVQLRDQLEKRTSIEYDALSYTWGDQSETFPITCNNQELRVHHNLKHALPFLAQRDSPLPIWIDAVCINQTDKSEKMTQIRLMKKIYEEASHVWVWLGPGNEYSENVIAMLPRIVEETEDKLDMIKRHFSTDPVVMPWLSSDEAWTTFYDLVDNKWYSRLWVFQETAFAKKVRVLLGSHEVHWEVLRHTIQSGPASWHFVGADGQSPRNVDRWAHNIFKAREITQNAVTSGKSLTAKAATRILTSTMHAHCFDPRDRIFALLGFILVQVAEDMPIEDMYPQMARSILLNLSPTSAHWWAFLNSAASANKRQGLPSWCPDFHDVAGRTSEAGIIRSFSASTRKNQPETVFDLRSKELVLRGQVFDKLETVLPEYRDESSKASERLRAFHSWEQSTEIVLLTELKPARGRGSWIYPTEAAITQAYWATLNGIFMVDGKATTPYKSLKELRQGQYAALQDIETRELLEETAFALEPSRESFPEAMKHLVGIGPIENLVQGKQMFITAQGRIGLGPSNISQGDWLCIFSYAKTAHVLRRTPDVKETTYTLVGDAYVHGMMHGEIEDFSIEEQDVVLV